MREFASFTYRCSYFTSHALSAELGGWEGHCMGFPDKNRVVPELMVGVGIVWAMAENVCISQDSPKKENL